MRLDKLLKKGTVMDIVDSILKALVLIGLIVAVFALCGSSIAHKDKIDALELRVKGLERAWRKDHAIPYPNVIPPLEGEEK